MNEKRWQENNRKSEAKKLRETENREWETEKARYKWSYCRM